jgi:hypothetical protein
MPIWTAMYAVFCGNWRAKVEIVYDEAIQHRGVELASRYGNLNEINLMKEVIDVLAPAESSHIASIFCDSKASAVYSVEVYSKRDCTEIGHKIDIAFRALAGGHNGIVIEGEDMELFLPPWWVEQIR